MISYTYMAVLLLILFTFSAPFAWAEEENSCQFRLRYVPASEEIDEPWEDAGVTLSQLDWRYKLEVRSLESKLSEVKNKIAEVEKQIRGSKVYPDHLNDYYEGLKSEREHIKFELELLATMLENVHALEWSPLKKPEMQDALEHRLEEITRHQKKLLESTYYLKRQVQKVLDVTGLSPTEIKGSQILLALHKGGLTQNQKQQIELQIEKEYKKRHLEDLNATSNVREN